MGKGSKHLHANSFFWRENCYLPTYLAYCLPTDTLKNIEMQRFRTLVLLSCHFVCNTNIQVVIKSEKNVRSWQLFIHRTSDWVSPSRQIDIPRNRVILWDSSNSCSMHKILYPVKKNVFVDLVRCLCQFDYLFSKT